MRGPVIVGIERPPSVTPALQAYIDSDGGAEAEARLMAAFFDGSGWGLSSVAFLDLFRRLRTVRSSGASIGMVGFQQAAAEGSADQTPYERGLAHQLIVAADAAPQARLIVLVGNLHARKAPWLSARSGAFEPMAMHLPGDDVLTFNIANTDGEVFNCAYDDCSVHRVAGSDAGAPPRVELLDDRRVYDGLWAVGAMTASEPIGVRRD